ncbi:MAG: hypothetical protein K0R15_1335 [Clostridiales bacterium]|nr:hypothetical protein [Clostridiales bacterium]
MNKILKFIMVSIIIITALSCNYIVAATNNVKITKASEFKDVKGTEWFTPNIQVAYDPGDRRWNYYSKGYAQS